MASKKILLVDDDELLASLLRYKMEKSGYSVDLAHNGEEVKEYLSRTFPDIIVSDIMMPYMSGIELVDYVRNVLKSEVPIIVVSSAGNEDNVLSAFELGANDFLSKPVSPSELMVRVTREISKIE